MEEKIENKISKFWPKVGKVGLYGKTSKHQKWHILFLIILTF